MPQSLLLQVYYQQIWAKPAQRYLRLLNNRLDQVYKGIQISDAPTKSKVTFVEFWSVIFPISRRSCQPSPHWIAGSEESNRMAALSIETLTNVTYWIISNQNVDPVGLFLWEWFGASHSTVNRLGSIPSCFRERRHLSDILVSSHLSHQPHHRL